MYLIFISLPFLSTKSAVDNLIQWYEMRKEDTEVLPQLKDYSCKMHVIM